MSNQPLAVHVKCRGNDKCIFDGKDLFIDIAIENRGSSPVGFPLALRQMTGPSIHLIDRRSHSDITLPTNPGNPDLADELTSIDAGQALKIDWVIKPSEIDHFANPDIDITAQVTLACKIKVNGKMEDFRATDSLHITGRVHR